MSEEDKNGKKQKGGYAGCLIVLAIPIFYVMFGDIFVEADGSIDYLLLFGVIIFGIIFFSVYMKYGE